MSYYFQCQKCGAYYNVDPDVCTCSSRVIHKEEDEVYSEYEADNSKDFEVDERDDEVINN